eukprot:scaffold48402_cov77-Cyclotella_meneghiniana.AAC.2
MQTSIVRNMQFRESCWMLDTKLTPAVAAFLGSGFEVMGLAGPLNGKVVYAITAAIFISYLCVPQTRLAP